jgi:hypothetical protein
MPNPGSTTGVFSAPTISLTQWNPSTPYLDKIEEAGIESAFSQYMEQKKYYGNSPAFYLDCSHIFFNLGKKETGLQILSNGQLNCYIMLSLHTVTVSRRSK